MKKTTAGIISLALTVVMLSGSIASAAGIEATDNQGDHTASSTESQQGENVQGENTQGDNTQSTETETGAEESPADAEGSQVLTILEFSEFDMKGQTPYQTIEVPKGTPLEELGLASVIPVVVDGGGIIFQ